VSTLTLGLRVIPADHAKHNSVALWPKTQLDMSWSHFHRNQIDCDTNVAETHLKRVNKKESAKHMMDSRPNDSFHGDDLMTVFYYYPKYKGQYCPHVWSAGTHSRTQTKFIKINKAVSQSLSVTPRGAIRMSFTWKWCWRSVTVSRKKTESSVFLSRASLHCSSRLPGRRASPRRSSQIH